MSHALGLLLAVQWVEKTGKTVETNTENLKLKEQLKY
jgi:hypothetical protein